MYSANCSWFCKNSKKKKKKLITWLNTFNIPSYSFGGWIWRLFLLYSRRYTWDVHCGWSLDWCDAVGDVLMELPPLLRWPVLAQKHFWIQTSACSGPVEHAQQYAKVRWVPRVLLNRTSSSALPSCAQHKTLQYNARPYEIGQDARTEKKKPPQSTSCSKATQQYSYSFYFRLIHFPPAW